MDGESIVSKNSCGWRSAKLLNGIFTIRESDWHTVTAVKASPDLSHAKVFVRDFGRERKNAKKCCRVFVLRPDSCVRALSQRLHHLRRVPELAFDYDENGRKRISYRRAFRSNQDGRPINIQVMFQDVLSIIQSRQRFAITSYIFFVPTATRLDRNWD